MIVTFNDLEKESFLKLFLKGHASVQHNPEFLFPCKRTFENCLVNSIFLLFPHCFLPYNQIIHHLTLSHTIQALKKIFLNIIGKGDLYARYQYFFHFPTMFSPQKSFVPQLVFCLQMLSIATSANFCHLVKGIN